MTQADRPQPDHTPLWSRLADGDPAARDRLLAAHYAEFRAIARRVLRGDGAQLALQPTDLAHEAALRILKLERIDWRDRSHFLALAVRVMRQTLLDEIRRLKADKRQRPEIVTTWLDPSARALPIEALDDALTRLFEIDPERAHVVELRFYAGLTIQEIAHVQSISLSTVERRWRGARAWLLAALTHDE